MTANTQHSRATAAKSSNFDDWPRKESAGVKNDWEYNTLAPSLFENNLECAIGREKRVLAS